MYFRALFISFLLIGSACAASVRPEVLQLAKQAYKKVQKERPLTRYLSIIDFELPSSQPRFFIYDMAKDEVLLSTHSSHGRASGHKYAKSFSNQLQSYQSSLGVFQTGQTYQGKHGLSLKLHGLEPTFNDNAFKRNIVIHGAKYLSKPFIQARGYAGRSHGCPAVDTKVAHKVIELIKGGSLVFAYYPDATWLSSSRFLNT